MKQKTKVFNLLTLAKVNTDLKIFHGYYVTPEGELYSLKTGAKKYTWLNKGRVNLYERTQFWIDGKKKNFYVHRIVAMLYLPDWNPDMEVDHIDEDTLNNHVTNLKMIWPTENKVLKSYETFTYKTIRGTNCIVKQGIVRSYSITA